MTSRQLVLVYLFFFGTPLAWTETTTSAPLEAELLMRITSRSVKPGSLVYARAMLAWSAPGCTLAQGATIEATVTAAVPHGSKAKQAQLALTFDRAQCGDAKLHPFSFQLAAVAAPPDPELGALAMPLPSPAGVMRAAAQAVEADLENVQRFPSNQRLRPGQVLGIPGIKLNVSSGADNSAVFSRHGYDVTLDEHTRLLLVPTSDSAENGVLEPAVSEDPAEKSAGEATLLRTAVDPPTHDADGEVCAGPGCASDEPVTEDKAAAEHFVASIPLAPLGLAPRVHEAMFDTSPDEVLAWLAHAELLVTFNPHELVPRHNEHSDGCVRVIRAVLLNTRDGKILRSMEWHLHDRRQFLWMLPGNRVLAHVGDELRIYGAGLTLERQLPLSGSLEFARVSPDGKTIAIGILQERHAPHLHELMRTALDHEPEEDVAILVLNDRFETVASSVSTSDRTAPVLMNEGQISITAGPIHGVPAQRRYRIQLHRWDGARTAFGAFESTCMPVLSAMQPDLLFMVTCDTFNGAREYRVLRADGTSLMRGHALIYDTGLAARADGSGSVFAVRVFRADQPLLTGESFRMADLEAVELGVYRAQDGKRLFSVSMRDPAASTAGYAISPQGEVALFAQDHVELFAMPKN